MSVSTAEEIKFSDELLAFIEEWKTKPGNLIMILHKVQGEFGYIPRQAAVKVSEMIDVPLAKIYGVITFYHFFKSKKPGKYIIQVCLGTACYLRGGADIMQELETILNISPGQVTDDGLFSIEAVRCIGCCGLAPVIMIGGEVFGKLTAEDVPGIIADFRARG